MRSKPAFLLKQNKTHEAKRHKERALFSDIIVETNLSLSLNASLSL
ncbi:MAG: hypothetical protein JOY96_08120 [Verrucomicrobia bacterium]|nr:hypothetical protein [Verrucomicrobiota bacterium]MBV9671854.1 hypothetical protein [Verrucomicrobiota bacterium]